jgi:Ca-activated chloride channel family protein
MNEEDILRAVKAATSIEVSSRTDETVLKAARARAASMGEGSRETASTAVRKRRFFRHAAAAAVLLLACGITLFAALTVVVVGPATFRRHVGWDAESPDEPAFQSHTEDSGGHLPVAPDRSPMAHGGTTPPNDAAYDAMFFKHYGVNPFIDTDDNHLSTFAVDVDTGSYTMARKYLKDGHMPPAKAVRTEEFINYFDYGYAPPGEGVFAIYLEGAPSEFGPNDKYYLLRIGLKAKEISRDRRKDANLVFVVDESGSMGRENRIGLVRKSLRMLLDELRPADRVAIVAYSGEARTVLEPTCVRDEDAIIRAVESLVPRNTTNAEAGLLLGYRHAERMFDKGRINRVILCSDGVANVGDTGAEKILERLKVEEYARKGIYLTAVGFGMGNYNDVLMEQLADRGDGHYAYVDTIEEAKRLFVETLVGTLQVVARDVKVQVDFNPEIVSRYRLLGYENRRVDDEDFRDDTVDGGEMGAGHSVTALYEIKFRKGAEPGRVASFRVRYTNPDTDRADEIGVDIASGEFAPSFEKAGTAFRLAAGVAEFAEIMRESYWAQKSTFADVLPVIRGVLDEREDDADLIELQALISKAMKINCYPKGSDPFR